MSNKNNGGTDHDNTRSVDQRIDPKSGSDLDKESQGTKEVSEDAGDTAEVSTEINNDDTKGDHNDSSKGRG